MTGINPSDSDASERILRILRYMLNGPFFKSFNPNQLDHEKNMPGLDELAGRANRSSRERPYFFISMNTTGPDGKIRKKTWSNLLGHSGGADAPDYRGPDQCEDCPDKSTCNLYRSAPERPKEIDNFRYRKPEKESGDGLAHDDSLEDIKNDLRQRTGPEHLLADLFSFFGSPGLRSERNFSFEFCEEEMDEYRQELEREIASNTPETPQMSGEELKRYQRKLMGESAEDE